MTTLGEICGGGGVQTGPFGSQLHAADYVEDGVPVIMPQDLVDGRIDTANVARVSEDDAQRLGRHRVEPGDIVYSRRGDIRRRVLIKQTQAGWLCGTGCLRVRIGDGTRPDYVATYLGHPAVQDWIERHAVGATMLNLNTKILSALPVVLPSPDEQKQITSVLGALDDKIDSNRRLARLLEQIAQTEFQARFVDFIGVADLAQSGDGPIPSGWHWRAISSLARYVNGKAFTKFGNGRGRMVIRIADLKSGPGGSTVYTDHEPENDDFVARAGDILFAWSGSLDVYRWYREEALINQHIFKVVPEGDPQWLVYFALKHVMPHFQAIAADKATTMGHIKRSDLARFVIPMPPREELAQVDSFFVPIYDHSLRALIEAESLTSIRNALLPKLISGEIRVPDTADPGAVIEPLVDEVA